MLLPSFTLIYGILIRSLKEGPGNREAATGKDRCQWAEIIYNYLPNRCIIQKINVSTALTRIIVVMGIYIL